MSNFVGLTANRVKGNSTKPIFVTQDTPYKIPQIRSRVPASFVDGRDERRTITLKGDVLKSTVKREQHSFIQGTSFSQRWIVAPRRFPRRSCKENTLRIATSCSQTPSSINSEVSITVDFNDVISRFSPVFINRSVIIGSLGVGISSRGME
jgi:hypothetical protein